MKKLITIIFVFIFLLGAVGCSQQPQQVQGSQLLAEGTVVHVDISSLPEGYNYSFTGKDAKAIIDYLSNLHLDSHFEENPDEYAGMTWIISLKYDNDEVLTVYHFGNMFIRSEKGPWYKMTYDEASRFDALLEDLNK